LTLPNWSYIYYVRMPSFRGIEILQTIVIAVTTIAAGAIFAILIAFRTYDPVRQMVQQVREFAPDKSNRLEPKDEFKAFQSIARTMQQENQKLVNKLDEYHKPMHERLLRDLTLGMLSREDALRMLQEYQMEPLIHRSL